MILIIDYVGYYIQVKFFSFFFDCVKIDFYNMGIIFNYRLFGGNMIEGLDVYLVD